jgi:ERCC4-type nuclease
VVRTNTICETADTIIFFADKYDKTITNEKNRKPYYDLTTSIGDNGVVSTNAVIQEVKEVKELTEAEESEKYCGVVKGHKEKNEYITPDNINIIMLTCVPGISSKVATQLMREYKSIQNLLYQLEKKHDILNTFMIKTDGVGAKTTFRKINKTCVENIKKFLMTTHATFSSSN